MAAATWFGHVLFCNIHPNTCSSNGSTSNCFEQGEFVVSRPVFLIRDISAHGLRTNLAVLEQIPPAKWLSPPPAPSLAPLTYGRVADALVPAPRGQLNDAMSGAPRAMSVLGAILATMLHTRSYTEYHVFMLSPLPGFNSCHYVSRAG